MRRSSSTTRSSGKSSAGLLVFVGVAAGDGPTDIDYIASKIHDVRIFADADGRMNRSIREADGAVLVVSQFTLLGDVRKGRRPAFDAAATPDAAADTYEALVGRLETTGLRVETGRVSGRHEGRTCRMMVPSRSCSTAGALF